MGRSGRPAAERGSSGLHTLPARIVEESSTVSECVARGIEAAGFEVLVVEPCP